MSQTATATKKGKTPIKAPPSDEESEAPARKSAPSKANKAKRKPRYYESDSESDYSSSDDDEGEDEGALPTGQLSKTAGGLGKQATKTLGGVAGGVLQSQGKSGGDGEKQDTLRLRLDLNLEIEITLKARIHGDLELALLTG